MQLSSAAQVNIACSAKMERQQIVSVAESAARRLGYEQLRDLQLKVVAEVVTGRDVFAILPGYGKSLCYMLSCHGCLTTCCSLIFPPLSLF